MTDPDDLSLDESGTLYDPPEEEGATSDPSNEDSITFQLSLSQEQARRLRAVANQLGLPASLVATRAIELVCSEVVTIEEVVESPESMLEQYQTQLDLLHTVTPSDDKQMD